MRRRTSGGAGARLETEARRLFAALRSAPRRSVPGRGAPRSSARAAAILAAAAGVLLAACSEATEPAPPPPPSPVDTDTADRAALIAFYNAAGGPGWSNNANWNDPSARIENWYGVETDAQGYVTALELPDNGLAGTLAPQLGDLSRLRRLDLGDNELAGSIPSELGSLSELARLLLPSNALTGSIPASLGSLSRLDTLNLNRNGLDGPIPPELGELASLRSLGLALNRLSGPVPPELGRLSALRLMTLSGNELTGTVPPELGDLERIEVLSVSRNQIIGAVPPELGGLSRLERLYLYDNMLTGGIPPELGGLSRLETLWIHVNELSGPIPDEIGGLGALQDLLAYGNQLSGPIPAALGGLSSLSRLHLASNRLAGGLPPEFGHIEPLQQLYLDNNPDLAGLLPRSFMELEELSNLSFAGTGLCAQIDPVFQAWLEGAPNGERPDCDDLAVERLALLALHEATEGDGWRRRGGWGGGGAAEGWDGVTAGAGGRVVALDLADNGLVGPLIPDIANFARIERLDLSGNDLEGGLPETLALLPELAQLKLDGNARLVGPLPFALRALERVEVLTFAGTGVCASPSSGFQSWFGGIAVTAGATCGNPEAVTAAIQAVYLTQAIQDQGRNVRLVAGRDALLRVFVTAEEPRGFFEPEVAATFTLVGEELHRAVMTRDDDRIPAEVDEADLAMSYNVVVPGSVVRPGVAMVIELDPDGEVPLSADSQTRFPALAREPLNAVAVPAMELTIVPVFEASAPDSSVLEWTEGIDADAPQVGLLRHAFPFERFSATVREPLLTSLDLTSEDDQWRMVLELEAARTARGATGYWYGVALSVNGYVRGRARISGWASLGKPWATELAHEVGHNLSLRHAPCGDPPQPDPDYPHSGGSIGVWGYDFRDGTLVSPRVRRDIMGYCYAQGWLSDYHFGRVIDYREQTEGSAAPAGARPRVLVLWGGVLNGEPQIEPVFAMRGAPVLPGAAGPYRIRGEDASGRALFAYDFEPGADKFGDRYFFLAVPIESEWDGVLERVTLVAPEGVVSVDGDDGRVITIATERATGALRAILRGEAGAAIPAVLPAALRDGVRAGELDVATTRGPGEAVRRR